MKYYKHFDNSVIYIINDSDKIVNYYDLIHRCYCNSVYETFNDLIHRCYCNIVYETFNELNKYNFIEEIGEMEYFNEVL